MLSTLVLNELWGVYSPAMNSQVLHFIFRHTMLSTRVVPFKLSKPSHI